MGSPNTPPSVAPPAGTLPSAAVPPKPRGFVGKSRAFFKRHGRKLWWLHSCYALGLGIGVMLLAQKGAEFFRVLALFLGGAWLLFLLFFRIFRSGAQRRVDGRAAKVAFVAMNYVMKDAYQAMLFFLLPFYWKSSTWGAANFWYAAGLGACALLATLDVVFDHYVMRWRFLASVYYLIALFSCLNLLIPAVLPSVPSSWALVAAAGISSFVFLTLHVRLRYLLARVGLVAALLVMAVTMSGVYAGRRFIPPVPYSTTYAVAGTIRLDDGRVVDPVGPVPVADLPRVVAVTDVLSPLGGAESFRHVWRREGAVVATLSPELTRIEGRQLVLRLRSELARTTLPDERTGRWTIDVETTSGQLVGRTAFTVRP